MSVKEIEKRAAAEARLYAIAAEVRKLLDEAKALPLADDRDLEEEVISLATGE